MIENYYLEIVLFFIFSWWVIVGYLYWGNKENKKLAQISLFGPFYPLLKNDSNKSLSTREIVGLISLTLAVLIIGILAITGVIDGSY